MFEKFSRGRIPIGEFQYVVNKGLAVIDYLASKIFCLET